jgi:hypothetical protein
MEKTPDDQVHEVLEPAEQQTILFYDKPLIVVRLPHGEPGAVLRYFCDNLGLAQNRQIDRIKRKKALAAGLHYARIETAGGPQVLAVLTLRVVPGWLFGIDTNRVKPELQPEIERRPGQNALTFSINGPRRRAKRHLLAWYLLHRS